jgi:hypothetical protein
MDELEQLEDTVFREIQRIDHSRFTIVNHVSYGFNFILYRNHPTRENKAKASTTR